MKKALMSIVIILILATVIWGCLFFNKKNDINQSNHNVTIDDITTLEEGWKKNQVYKLESITDFYTIRNIINKYYSYYYSLYDENSELTKSEILNNLYSILDKKYIEKYNLTLDNIESKFPIKVNEVDVNLEKVLYITNNDNMFVYFVCGNVRDTRTNEYSDFNMIVSLDVINKTFSIMLQDYYDEMNYCNINEGEIINYNFSYHIEVNAVNKYKPHEYSFKEYVNDMFEEIRKYIIYNPEKAYSLLNKNNIFSSYNEFKEFIEDNYREIFIMTLDSYVLEYKDDSVIYNCKEKYNNFNVLIYANNPCDITFNILKLK